MPLQVFQSMWAMIGLPHGVARPWSPDEQFERILDEGFDGVSVSFHDVDAAVSTCRTANEHDLAIEAVCYPDTPGEFDELLNDLHRYDIADISHINMQPMLRTASLDVAAEAIERWYESANQADIALKIETHRGRLTSDILFTLELLDRVPQMRLTADLSHYVNGDEFAIPVPPHTQQLVDRLLARSDVFHGRIASPGQVQIPVDGDNSKPLLDLFTSWWRSGFQLRHSENPEALVTFTAELGPPQDSYAIVGTDGSEITDRWSEALRLRDIARTTWYDVMSNDVLGGAARRA